MIQPSYHLYGAGTWLELPYYCWARHQCRPQYVPNIACGARCAHGLGEPEHGMSQPFTGLGSSLILFWSLGKPIYN